MNEAVHKFLIAGTSDAQFRHVQDAVADLPVKLSHVNVRDNLRMNTSTLPTVDQAIIVGKFVNHKTTQRLVSVYGRQRIVMHWGGLTRLAKCVRELCV